MATILVICIAANNCMPIMQQFPSAETCSQFAIAQKVELYECIPVSEMTPDRLMQIMITGSIPK